MSRSVTIVITVRTLTALLNILESQKIFIVSPSPESHKAIGATSLDNFGVPNWETLDATSSADIFEKMRSALRDNGVSGFHVRYKSVDYSLCLRLVASGSYEATWNCLESSVFSRIAGSIPDLRQSIEVILLSLGSLVDCIERVAWEYGE